jgi:hypothetical protein
MGFKKHDKYKTLSVKEIFPLLFGYPSSAEEKKNA